ncbi:MAG: penicillin acylase family protein [Ekhidna sp.]|nr:penicillin acylase family protein [Ekhidna sp.]
MKTFRFILSFIITIATGICLNTKFGSVPPLGKFLSPFHGFWQNAENKAIDPVQNLVLDGLKEPVNVYFDDLLIPHIKAQNEEDLFFTQAYITAYHRLWQMEFQLLAAEGRISEILGSGFLNFDRGQRRIGLKYGAEASLDLFRKEEPAIYRLVAAFTAGVNAYIESLDYKDYPIEYKLLDYKPEEWTPFKCFLLISNMHSMLSGGERDLEHTNALKKWGREVFEILYPERPLEEKLDPVIPRETDFNFVPVKIEKPSVKFPLSFTLPTLETPNPANGSNSFVVNGNKTTNGKVILTNEPDLNLNLPSIWYVAHLNCPTINVMGATLPGGPGVIIGFNDSIAWGNTNAKRDLVDWYHIQYKDESRNEYLYNNNWVPTKKVIEKFEIRGSKPFYDTIVYTHHGPVVYDESFGEGRSEITNLAMKWTAHLPSKEIKAIYLVNKASQYDQFVEALSNFSGPPQNYSFAAANGDIALWVNGKFPVKWEEQGKFLMDGSEVDHEWKAYIPHDHNLHIKNPDQNFVSSANQHAADTLYPYYQYDYNYEYYRGRRINERLRIMSNIEVEDMMKLQHDNFNYNAFEAMPMMLDSLDTASFTDKEQKYYTLLRSWDYFNHPDKQAPSVYETWWSKLNSKLWDEIDNSDVKVYRPGWFNTVNILSRDTDFFMIDNQTTTIKETSGDLFRDTFRETIEALEEYLEDPDNTLLWYEFKNTTVQHLLRLAPFSFDKIKIGGNKSIVNAASKRHGPSWRMVVELGDGEVNAWGVYPGSQTGNPGNPKYGHMIDDWANGEYYPLLFKRDLNKSEINCTITLQPK